VGGGGGGGCKRRKYQGLKKKKGEGSQRLSEEKVCGALKTISGKTYKERGISRREPRPNQEENS